MKIYCLKCGRLVRQGDACYTHESRWPRRWWAVYTVLLLLLLFVVVAPAPVPEKGQEKRPFAALDVLWGQNDHPGAIRAAYSSGIATSEEAARAAKVENDLILAAIAELESGVDDLAHNAAEDALGRYQIRPAFWEDGAREIGSRMPHYPGALNPELSRKIILGYWKKYGARTLEQKARIFNGGPRGCEKPSTVLYFKRIRNIVREKQSRLR